ncbi:FtsX-like permease family protein [Streptomyces johnsoniae]|uniref:FtsX-like permease family protein n=1 Tax=Streptomyces johnsoniae TaxID=3075532 RepID=A0ABU2SDL6_9ACTN|nr:FtsX-like permease family protein [Streptomyces sp. DSM 41886]MDT0447066.1 FtsX-like permease family protein [Streptomyces sp. DSM 41886]
MFSLALRSVRQRPGRFVGTLLAAFLGAAVTMAFNSMHDTAGAAGVDDRSAETLSLTGGIVGGYGTLLVFFAIASTLTVNVRQREEEMGLLRRTGATPAQIKRMVVGEAVLVALAATLLAIGPAMLGGNALLDMFLDTEQVAAGVDFTFGPIALSAGFGITLIAAAGAAYLAVRRATRAAAGAAGAAGAGEPSGRLRNVGGGLALVAGLGGVATTFAFESDDPALMAPAAWGAILLSIGLAAFSPALLRMLLRRVGRPIGAMGAGGYLAVLNTRQRAAQLAGVLMPMVLFVGVATATIYVQAVESDAIAASGLARSVDDKNLESVNLIVVGIIVGFACIMLINSLYAATSYRSREFGGQRLAGATPRQVLGMVLTEGLLLTVTGVVLGTAAGLAGLVPFNVVRTDTVWPEQSPLVWFGIVATAAAATVVTGWATARRALRTPAVVAVTKAA